MTTNAQKYDNKLYYKHLHYELVPSKRPLLQFVAVVAVKTTESVL